MKEIKFRAWDYKEKRMLKSVGFSDSDCGRSIHCEAYMIGGGERYSLYDIRDGKQYKRFILMQFTGLKDKNGKKIYEGDIVKYYDSTTMWLTSEVINTGACFAIKTDENPIPFYEFCGDYIYDGHPIKEIEVIGNIYENPELNER